MENNAVDTKVKDLITSSMSKIHEMADANTVLGTPIKVDGVTIIPVSKISYGFASGGSDIPNKSGKELFGGAAGSGVTVTPLGFLVVSDGEVQMMQMNLDVSASSAIVNMVPDVINKVTGLFKKDKDGKKDTAEAVDTDTIELPEEMVDEEGDTDSSLISDFT